MRRQHDRTEILDAALAVAADDGLSQITFGRVAKRLGISDRTVVYYFATKDDLITEVVLAMGGQLQETLSSAFSESAADHVALLRTAWPLLTTPGADAVFALFFEANGLATARREPYADLVPKLVEMWIAWLAEFIDGDPDIRRTEAATAIAVVDGLLLLRQLAGADTAERAARRLDIA